MGRQEINLSESSAGQKVEVKAVGAKIWLMSSMRYDLGFFHHKTDHIKSAENPFTAKVLPMSPGINRYLRNRNGQDYPGRGSRIRTCDPLLPKQMRYQTAPCPDRAVHLNSPATLRNIV